MLTSAIPGDSQTASELAEIANFLQLEDVTLRFFQESTNCAASLILPVGDPGALEDVQLGTALVLLSAAVYCLSAFIKTFLRLKTSKIVCKED